MLRAPLLNCTETAPQVNQTTFYFASTISYNNSSLTCTQALRDNVSQSLSHEK